MHAGIDVDDHRTCSDGNLTSIVTIVLFVLLIVLRDSVRTFKRYLVDASCLAPLVGGIMAVVWSFTTGRLNQAEWMGVALLYGTTTSGRLKRAGAGDLASSDAGAVTGAD